MDDICLHHGISSAKFYSWRKKYGGMEAGDAKRLSEPRRVCRRLISVSYAALGSVSRAA
ncbi:hypothetical protein FGE21_19395 [Phaeobacter sp. B1627]|nr:hypothetical protein FGE21_19395 [Phaeobacter sp. B1627]